MAGPAAAFAIPREVLQRLPLMLMAVDPRGRIVFWNGDCARLTGHPQSVVGADAGFLRRRARAQDEAGAALLEAMACGQPGPTMIASLELLAAGGPPRRTLWLALPPGQMALAGEEAAAGTAPWCWFVGASLESGGDLVLLQDSKGRIAIASPWVRSLLGWEPAEWLGSNPMFYLHPDEAAAVREGMMAAWRAGSLRLGLRHRLRHRDGHHSWFQTEASPQLQGAAGAGKPEWVVTVSRDVSRSVALPEGEGVDPLRAALFTGAVGVFDIRLPEHTGSFSDEYLRLFGYGPEYREVFESGWFPLVHPDDAPAFLARRELQRSGVVGFDERVVRRMHRDGHYLWVRWTAMIAGRHPDGTPSRLVGTMQDVTERHLAEAALRDAQAQLRALSSHLDEQLDGERRRIATEVHDELGQLLSAARLELSQLAGGMPPAAARGLARAAERIDEALEVVRHVAESIWPPALEMGLGPALEWMGEDFALRTEIDCRVRVDEALTLPRGVSLELFRIAQEGLTNVMRHARGAQRVEIALSGGHGAAELSVGDDGCGFNAEQVMRRRPFGLIGMRERALRVDGLLEIDSRPGAGTRLRVKVPVVAAGMAP